VKETPLATAGGTRPPAITVAPPPPGYQGAWRSHSLLLRSSCIPFDATGNPEKASSTRLLEKADLNGLQFLLTIFIINHIIPTPIHPVSGLVQEFTKLINTYNMDHPTPGFQYSIFYPVAGDSYPSVVIPDLDRELAHGLPNLSKQLRSRLRHGSSTAGLVHLANHTCCPHHRNSELQILSVWQEDWTSSTLQGPAGDGSGAQKPTAPGRTFVASLKDTKLIRKGTPVLTCYRNTSSAGTTAQLIKERETLSRMFKCSCRLCGGSCRVSGSVVGLGPAIPFSLLDPKSQCRGGRILTQSLRRRPR
jgi:hypothetical protein